MFSWLFHGAVFSLALLQLLSCITVKTHPLVEEQSSLLTKSPKKTKLLFPLKVSKTHSDYKKVQGSLSSRWHSWDQNASCAPTTVPCECAFQKTFSFTQLLFNKRESGFQRHCKGISMVEESWWNRIYSHNLWLSSPRTATFPIIG